MSLRSGQALFVVFAGTDTVPGVDPAFAEVIRGTDLDPFYRDERIPAMLAAWRERLRAETRETCARVCDERVEVLHDLYVSFLGRHEEGEYHAAMEEAKGLGAAIREREGGDRG